ncbi:MAG TPA: nicotinate-nucleotide adenylyltransferase [Candidatus Binatia bacterium]|jgi:nicotinate-nucleotide adenylyltransferase
MCAESARGAGPRRVGVLGGTFDPVHLGHIRSAREIAEAFSLDVVRLVLAARPPHKPSGASAAAEDRWQMLILAVAEAECSGEIAPGLVVPCDIELRRSSPSWTVDTLRELSANDPEGELFFIVGSDAYAEVDTWSRPGELLALANVIVTSRPGRQGFEHTPLPPVAARAQARYDSSIGVYVHTSGHQVRGHGIRGIEVSSTEIRRRVRLGLPVQSMTGPAVARFIADHGLYQSDSQPSVAGQRPAAGELGNQPSGAGKHCKE